MQSGKHCLLKVLKFHGAFIISPLAAYLTSNKNSFFDINTFKSVLLKLNLTYTIHDFSYVETNDSKSCFIMHLNKSKGKNGQRFFYIEKIKGKYVYVSENNRHLKMEIEVFKTLFKSCNFFEIKLKTETFLTKKKFSRAARQTTCQIFKLNPTPILMSFFVLGIVEIATNIILALKFTYIILNISHFITSLYFIVGLMCLKFILVYVRNIFLLNYVEVFFANLKIEFVNLPINVKDFFHFLLITLNYSTCTIFSKVKGIYNLVIILISNFFFLSILIVFDLFSAGTSLIVVFLILTAFHVPIFLLYVKHQVARHQKYFTYKVAKDSLISFLSRVKWTDIDYESIRVNGFHGNKENVITNGNPFFDIVKSRESLFLYRNLVFFLCFIATLQYFHNKDVIMFLTGVCSFSFIYFCFILLECFIEHFSILSCLIFNNSINKEL